MAGAFGLGGVSLGADPVKLILHTTGLWALKFLVATLLMTPLKNVTGWVGWLRFRRMLGLFVFFYALLHFSTYLFLDQDGKLGAASASDGRSCIAWFTWWRDSGSGTTGGSSKRISDPRSRTRPYSRPSSVTAGAITFGGNAAPERSASDGLQRLIGLRNRQSEAPPESEVQRLEISQYGWDEF